MYVGHSLKFIHAANRYSCTNKKRTKRDDLCNAL